MTTSDPNVWEPDSRCWEGENDKGPSALESAIFQAVGSASMCWEHVERAGVFDTERARQIGDGLTAWVHRWAMPREEERHTLAVRQPPLFTDIPLPFEGGGCDH